MGKKKKNIEPVPLLDINDEDLLQQLYLSYYPAGSGPLGVMRMVTRLIEAIAAEKGFTLLSYTDWNAKNNHCNS